MSETTSLLLEIGCEEVPARFLEAAEHDLGERLASALATSRLLHQRVLTGPLAELPGRALKPSGMRTYSTPRRLVAYVPELLAEQPGRVEEIIGPPVKVAFDKDGKPTRAAESFAAKNNAAVSDLKRVTNAKGEYLTLQVSEHGRSTLKVLDEMLPGVIGGIQFPKSMYWTAKAGPFFVRPIRWILAMLWQNGQPQVVPFQFAGVEAGTHTFGHRLDSQVPLEVADANLDMFLEKHLVVLHGAERRQRVEQGIKVLLEGKGLAAVKDESLRDWVVNSTEWPVPLLGRFDPRYLALSREVLVTVMRDHQKYFALEDEAGNLKPHFITVLNVPGDLKGLIRQGHERVLAARFADAEFFWNADQKPTLAERVPMLERVTYQAKLGTYADKVRRMKSIAENICAALEEDGRLSAEQREHIRRALDLCKCDLTTQMVQEFTELQGIMGGIYAKSQGETGEVADAIYDHYRPAGIEDSCPRSVVGAIVSLADKLDSVASGFSIGLEPTGSSDPFGLRRAGNGIIRILIEFQIRIDLPDFFGTVNQSQFLALCKFMADREQYILEVVLGFRYDSVRAAVFAAGGTGFLNPLDVRRSVEALEHIRGSEDMQAICAAAKRVRNIIKKSVSSADRKPGAIDKELLAPGPETELYDGLEHAKPRVLGLRSDGKYVEALLIIATLRPLVDRFFEEVLVMADDANVRRNRVLLVKDLDELFSSIADISQIESSTSNSVGAPTLNRLTNGK